jgi:hypothetical protein
MEEVSTCTLFSLYYSFISNVFPIKSGHGFKKEKYVSNLCIARERRNKVN